MVKNLKIKKLSASDLVCAKMKELIVSGEWRVGEKIPSENDLADSFGVNRLTVRIALQRLNALGILDTRVGDGTYVQSFDFSTHIEELSDFYVNDKILLDTREYRWIIESASVNLALDRPNEQLLEKLAQCCQAFEAEVKRYYTLGSAELRNKSLEKSVDIGLEFHTTLCELSNNELLRLAFCICKAPIRQHMLMNAKNRIDDPAGKNSSIWIKAYWDVYRALKTHNYSSCIEGLKQLISA